MKKIILLISFCFICSASFATQPPGFGSVQDNNNGIKGQILVNTGNQHGNSDIGTWVNTDFLKGEKGDKGEQGPRGKKGKKGDKGDRGEKGDKGDRGEKGDKGDRGEKGNDGNTGKDGKEGPQGEKGDTGENGKDIDPKTVNSLQNQIDKLQEPKYYLVPQIRIYDSKRLEVKPYAKFDMQNGGDFKEAGVKVTVKISKSYEEKLIEELTKKIEILNDSKPVTNVEYTYDNEGSLIGITSKF